MNRKEFLGIAGTSMLMVAAPSILLGNKNNTTNKSIKTAVKPNTSLTLVEIEILTMASLAPSGHNAQPWFVKFVEPYNWIVGIDKNKWLPAVDPTQRETMLSIGTFLQNLEFAANHFGYACQYNQLAKNNQDENVMEVQLKKTNAVVDFDIDKIKQRRTLRSHHLKNPLTKVDIDFLINNEKDFLHFIPQTSKEFLWLNEQTIAAGTIQTNRDNAQQELADWIRFTKHDAKKYHDGLTMASMEIEGISAWVLRNFYDKADVMKKSFREKSITTTKNQVENSGGWLLITSKDNSVASLIETGQRMERIFLKVREKDIGLHPMTFILEESSVNQLVNKAMGISEPIQFVLRLGYVKDYPKPVSLRRTYEQFLRA